MIKAAIIGLIVVLVFVSAASAENQAEAQVTLYLGLSIPYPESIPSLKASLKDRLVKSRSTVIYFAVDKKGSVKKVEYPADSAAVFEPLLKDLKKIKFQFLEGRDLEFPLTVPVEVTFASSDREHGAIGLKLPVSPEIISEPELLARLFERNGVEAPQVIELQPLYYRVASPRDGPDYSTVTARVFLDEKGELQDITYPIPGQSANSHQVQMALMNARFGPAKIKSQPAACDFLLTFRIFTNLKYPFSPLQAPDSTAAPPFTARYFMTPYFNAADIGVPALPRIHGAGQIQAANLGLGRTGIAELLVRIDSTGSASSVKVLKGTPGIDDRAGQAVRLINWYPARDCRGAARSFAGKISMTFDGSTRIVYIPEWVKP